MSIKDFNDAKRLIEFPELLKSLGYEPDPKKSKAEDIWYRSPFRVEDEASFHIRKGRKGFWLWKDFGGEGGTIIDFVMKLNGYNNPKEALDYLKDWYGGKPIQQSFKVEQLDSHSLDPEPDLKLKKVRPLKLKDKFQIEYVQSRGIEPEIACQVLQHITYRNTILKKDFLRSGLLIFQEDLKYEIGEGSKVA